MILMFKDEYGDLNVFEICSLIYDNTKESMYVENIKSDYLEIEFRSIDKASYEMYCRTLFNNGKLDLSDKIGYCSEDD